MKFFKNTLMLGISVGLITIGSTAAIANTFSKGHHKQKQDANCFWNSTSMSTDDKWGRVSDYQKEILDKLASVTYATQVAMGVSQDEAQAITQYQCGVFLNKTDFSITRRQTLLSVDNINTNISAAYSVIQQEGHKLGIDEEDWNDFDDNIKPNYYIQTYQQGLEDSGMSDSDVAQKVKTFTSDINKLESNGKLLQEDDLDFNLALLNKELSNFNATSSSNHLVTSQSSNKGSAISDEQMAYVLSNVGKHLNDYISLSSTCQNTAPLLQFYSSTPKYKEGDIVDLDDMQYFFNYSYLPMSGAYCKKPTFDYSKPIDAHDYDMKVIYRVNKPMNGYGLPKGATYQTGEVLPGYTLRAKILTEDVDSNADICHITFQFGISNTNIDPEGHNIIWDTSLGKAHLSTESTKVKYDLYLPVYSLDARRFIANTRYYPHSTARNITSNDYDPTYDAYFRNNDFQRAFLSKLLENAKVDSNGDYKLPIFIPYTQQNIDNKLFFGIPVPDVDNTIMSTQSNSMHTTENLSLRIEDVNTNCSDFDKIHNWCIKAQWVINDTTNFDSPSKNNDQYGGQPDIENNLNGATEAMTYLPWTIDNKQVNNSIWIKYGENSGYTSDIAVASNIALTFYADNVISQEYTDAFKSSDNKVWDEHLNDLKATLDTEWKYEQGEMGASAALGTAALVLGVVGAILLYGGFGKDGAILMAIAAIDIADNVILDIALWEGASQHDFDEWDINFAIKYNAIRKFIFNNLSFPASPNTIISLYPKLNDPHLSINAKFQAAEEVINAISVISKTNVPLNVLWTQFLDEVIKAEGVFDQDGIKTIEQNLAKFAQDPRLFGGEVADKVLVPWLNGAETAGIFVPLFVYSTARYNSYFLGFWADRFRSIRIWFQKNRNPAQYQELLTLQADKANKLIVEGPITNIRTTYEVGDGGAVRQVRTAIIRNEYGKTLLEKGLSNVQYVIAGDLIIDTILQLISQILLNYSNIN